MNTKLVALFLCSLTCAGIAAPKPAKVSRLSEFKGNYSGTIRVVTNGTPVFAPSRGTISSSKKKEKGTVSLHATLNVGTVLPFNEKYAISNHNLTYTLVATPSFGAGSGRVSVNKKTIDYSATFNIGSAGPYFVRGKMTKSGKDGRKLKIVETITGPATLFITYTLTKRGKK